MDGLERDRALLRDLAEHYELTPAALARRAEVAVTTINRPFSGTSTHRLSQPTLDKLRKAFADYPGWRDYLGSGVTDRKLAYRAPVADREDDDQVELASVDLGYGMGGTFLDIGDAEVERVPFSRDWLRRNVTESPPEVLGVAQGIGDSMEPVLFDRDLVFFDRSARLQDHVSDKTWVFAYGQVGMIKRLRPMPDGTVKIMSANRTYPDEIAGDGELHIIGRVVASLRRH